MRRIRGESQYFYTDDQHVNVNMLIVSGVKHTDLSESPKHTDKSKPC